MLTDLFKIIEVPIEKLITITEKRLERLEPGLQWGHWPHLLVVAIASALFGWLIVLIEAGLSHILTFNVPALAFLHNPVIWFVPILTVAFVGTLKLIVEYRRDKNGLANDIRNVKEELAKIKINIAIADTKLATRLRKELEAARNKTPFKELFEALEPNNAVLSTQLERIDNRALSSLERLARLNRLPDAVRQALENFLDHDFIAKPWGPLYLTFAINLQLEPWTRAATHDRFVFIRDSEIYKYDFGDEQQATAAFRARLELDLEEILKLVDGRLWSTMYKDLAIWNDSNYRNANDRLFSSTKGSADLRRLFFYEAKWLTDYETVTALYSGAKWHQATQYPCRFIEVPSEDGPVFQQRQDFLSSCVLNLTWIVMYWRKSDGFQSYLYRCDSEKTTVKNYLSRYEKLWQRARKPPEFIALVEKCSPGFIAGLDQYDLPRGNNR